MVIIKKSVKAYILLESLLSLGILALIVSLVLGEVDKNRQRVAESLHQQEVLNVAAMAVQTDQEDLILNGVNVHVERNKEGISINENGRIVLQVSKN
ncbi:competence type IV pilus minor pilin ComGE [Streptococcus orisratti]|uniref:competence type IV pilus minor pilin ComGE n=1 Tax=Streptococcus orisratti TaxID=114652 RepID=UPI00037B6799|nr:competence type IV pilus minor pilin ComGE [Streptococcus orisratti]MDY4002255.1 competence type IV pilus minor pilin ComGE [Streptococcus orisratti]MDY5636745.1 competence type IV pilus minor pilin ComGE [Streptococcus orisratti]